MQCEVWLLLMMMLGAGLPGRQVLLLLMPLLPVVS
jgi:hypothetical protein